MAAKSKRGVVIPDLASWRLSMNSAPNAACGRSGPVGRAPKSSSATGTATALGACASEVTSSSSG